MTLMTASPRAAATATLLLQPLLLRHGISSAVNVLPIPTDEFGSGLGLDTYSSYYMMLVRCGPCTKDLLM